MNGYTGVLRFNVFIRNIIITAEEVSPVRFHKAIFYRVFMGFSLHHMDPDLIDGGSKLRNDMKQVYYRDGVEGESTMYMSIAIVHVRYEILNIRAFFKRNRIKIKQIIDL